MKRTILIFGLISGAISSLMMVSTMPFLAQNRNHQRGDCWLYGHRALVHAGVLRDPVVSRECREW